MEIFPLNLFLLIVPVATNAPPLKQSTGRGNPASFPTMLLVNHSNKGSSFLRSNPLLCKKAVVIMRARTAGVYKSLRRSSHFVIAWCVFKRSHSVHVRKQFCFVEMIIKVMERKKKRIMRILPWWRNGPKKNPSTVYKKCLNLWKSNVDCKAKIYLWQNLRHVSWYVQKIWI